MQQVKPAPAHLTLRQRIKKVNEARQYPDAAKDKARFRAAWSSNGRYKPRSREFLDGELPHQKAMAARLVLDRDRSKAALDAIANEMNNYQATLVVLLAAVSLVAQTKLLSFIHSPASVMIWLPGAILLFVIRSHGSPLTSWITNYEGAGAYAAGCKSQYAYYDSLRDDVLRYNVRLQRAKRVLSLVRLLFTMCIVAACGYASLIGLGIFK